MIRIVYRTGEEGLVSPKFLDILLFLQQVQLFERTDGWVIVGVDKLRNSNPDLYCGPNLRRHEPTPLPAPIKSTFLPGNHAYYQ
jgi:hypothetical protein